MRVITGLILCLGLGILSGCNTEDTLGIEHVSNRVEHPLPAKMRQKLTRMNLSTSSPIMMRIFKQEAVMEVWKANAQDRYQLVATYPICAWSGQLGPKKKEGDRQAPEGFYQITPAQMNPNSSYYLSFDIGYPNKYDRAFGRTGRNIMVHGACASAGCYSISDAAVLQVYAFARDAFRGGQKSFQVQAFPFRMTAENMAKHRSSEYFEFWKNLKVGYDYFELTHRPPEVDVCNKKYAFNQTNGCNSGTPPALTAAYSSYSKSYEVAFAAATAKYPEGSWKDVPEFDRKAAERQARRMGKMKNIPNDANYVVVDPTAKNTTTSDSVASFSAAYQRIEDERAGKTPKVEYISVAEVEYRKKLEEAKRKEEERFARRMAKAKIPLPEANPIKPVVPVEQARVMDDGSENPFLKLWNRATSDEQEQAAVAPPADAEADAPKADTEVKPKKAKAKADEKPADETAAADAAKPADTADAGAQPTTEAAAKPGQKPFWKLW